METNHGPAATYYRISGPRDDMHAPKIYEEEIRRYCRYRRLELTEIFSDIDYSGWRQSRRIRACLLPLRAQGGGITGEAMQEGDEAISTALMNSTEPGHDASQRA
jgi:hypothetical protein